MTGITLDPLNQALGAEVSGVDPRESLDQATYDFPEVRRGYQVTLAGDAPAA